MIRRYFHEHTWITDALVAALFLLFVAGVVVVAAVAPGLPPVWAVVAVGAAGGLVVLLRRRRPVVMFALAQVIVIVATAVGTPAAVLLPPIMIYAVGVYRSTRAAWICFGAGAGVAIIAGYLEAILAPSLLGASSPASRDLVITWLNTSTLQIVVLLIATLIGTNVGGRNRYVSALLERAAQLARERDAQAEITSALERERIAREMHDVIAHSLSVMIALAEGARAAAPEHPERAADAIGRVAETGRRTLGEVRRLLGPVRGDEEGREIARAPQPGLDQVPALITEFARAGLPVHLSTSGSPSHDSALELTLYRLVQESLTNALRHAPEATTVMARLTWAETFVELIVDDDGPARSARTGDPGRGILGMRERVALYGGDLEAAPRPTGGWRVRARLPVERGPE